MSDNINLKVNLVLPPRKDGSHKYVMQKSYKIEDALAIINKKPLDLETKRLLIERLNRQPHGTYHLFSRNIDKHIQIVLAEKKKNNVVTTFIEDEQEPVAKQEQVTEAQGPSEPEIGLKIPSRPFREPINFEGHDSSSIG